MSDVAEIIAAPEADEAPARPVRGDKRPAPSGQRVVFINTERRYFRHATYASAQREKAFLSRMNPDADFRCLRLVQCPAGEIATYAAAPDLLRAGKHLAVKLAEIYRAAGANPSDCQAIRDFMAIAKQAEGAQ